MMRLRLASKFTPVVALVVAACLVGPADAGALNSRRLQKAGAAADAASVALLVSSTSPTRLLAAAAKDMTLAQELSVAAKLDNQDATALNVSINEGNAALNDLNNNPAFALATKDIQRDIAKQSKIVAAEQAAALADAGLATKLLADAQALEQDAANLEQPPTTTTTTTP